MYHVCPLAAENGHLDILEWMTEEGYKHIYDPDGAPSRESQGNLLCLTIRDVEGSDPIHLAMNGGHLVCLQFLLNALHPTCVRDNEDPGYELCSNAADNGHSHILRWLVEQGYDRFENRAEIVELAVACGLNTVKWLVDERHFPIHNEMHNMIAHYDSREAFEIFIWTIEVKKLEVTDETISQAVSGSSALILEWLIENEHATVGQLAERCLTSASTTLRWLIREHRLQITDEFIERACREYRTGPYSTPLLTLYRESVESREKIMEVVARDRDMTLQRDLEAHFY
jgi:hypothetical protein